MLFSPVLYIPQVRRSLEASKWGQVFIKEKKSNNRKLQKTKTHCTLQMKQGIQAQIAQIMFAILKFFFPISSQKHVILHF